MNISPYLSDDRILLDLQATTKADALAELLGVLEDADEISEFKQYVADVEHREAMGSTGIGEGLAFPHARSDAVDELCVVFGRSSAGIDFDAIDGKPVHLVFLMGAPNADLSIYLKALAHVSLMLRKESTRDALRAATTVDEVRGLLDQPLV